MTTDTVEQDATAGPKKRRGLKIALVAIGLLAAAVGWYLFSPLFLNSTVNEEFPTVTSATQAPTSAPVGAEPTTASGEAPAPAAADVDSPEEAPADGTATAEPPTTAPASEPVVLAEGEFVDADSFHQGSGSATIYELEDGSRILRLEDFDVTNGPDLHVFISPTPVPESNEDVMGAGYIDLGELKGNRGDQNYEIPADAVLPDGEFSVVIYCVPFHVVFSTATVSG